MRNILFVKFACDSDARQCLFETAGKHIQASYSKELFWGAHDMTKCENRLGVLLEEVRDTIMSNLR